MSFHKVTFVFADEKKGSNLVVWLVSEPCRRMPLDILHDVYVLSWHSLISLTADGSTEAANQPSPYCSMDQALANGRYQFNRCCIRLVTLIFLLSTCSSIWIRSFNFSRLQCSLTAARKKATVMPAFFMDGDLS